MASPRPSLSAVQSPSSSRTSLDTQLLSQQSGSVRAGNPSTRRNRAALRDYYKLRSSSQEGSQTANLQNGASISPVQADVTSITPTGSTALGSFDVEDFNAEAHVKFLLESEPLSKLLALENQLVTEIRALDGERKALVYDNYSKLISATDTIKKMRSNMDPLSPATSTLAPAISHIAETAAALSEELSPGDVQAQSQQSSKVQSQKDLVKWALDSPTRLAELLENGQQEEANQQWRFIQNLLEKWKGVKGCAELRESCERVMKDDVDE